MKLGLTNIMPVVVLASMLVVLPLSPVPRGQAQPMVRALNDVSAQGTAREVRVSTTGSSVHYTVSVPEMAATRGNTLYRVYAVNAAGGAPQPIGLEASYESVYPIGFQISQFLYAASNFHSPRALLDDTRVILAGVAHGLEPSQLANWGVWSVLIGDGSATRLSPPLSDDMRVMGYWVSPDARWVAYSVGRVFRQDYRNPEDGDNAPVTGTTFAFALTAVYLVPTDGSRPPVEITAGLTFPAEPRLVGGFIPIGVTFSPDSRTLVLTQPSTDATFQTLWAVPVSGGASDRQEITRRLWSFLATRFGFSADGSLLVYSTRDGLYSLRLPLTAGSQPAQVWQDPFDLAMVSWSISPAGDSVLYALDPIAPTSRNQMYLVPSQGPASAARQIGQGILLPYSYGPAWAAGGAYILANAGSGNAPPFADGDLISLPAATPEITPTVIASRSGIYNYTTFPSAKDDYVYLPSLTNTVVLQSVRGPATNRLTNRLPGAGDRFVPITPIQPLALVLHTDPTTPTRITGISSVAWTGAPSTLRRLTPSLSGGAVIEYYSLTADARWLIYVVTDGHIYAAPLPPGFDGPECRVTTTFDLNPIPISLPTLTNQLYLPSIGVCS